MYLFVEFRISDKQWENVISSDGRGYYHYLVEYFVPHEHQYPKKDQSFLVENNGQYYTKYSVGTAILLTPFFIAGCVWATLSGYELSGYSYPFQMMTGIGGLTYLMIGAVALFCLLRSYKFPKDISWFSVIAITFGTNLLYYGIMAGTMSHVYSFAAITGFAWLIRKSFITLSRHYLLLVMIIFGVLFLIRPFNALILLAIPALITDFSEVKVRFKKLLTFQSTILFGCLIITLLIALQLISWRQQSGEWILFSYPNEGFYFSDPKIFKVLFSFNKGLFIYTPLVLFSMIGIWFWFRNFKRPALYFTGFFMVVTYFISAWWCWNYASGFGLRPYIDFYGIFAIPLVFFLNQDHRKFRFLFTGLTVLLIAFNLLQSFQYSSLIMHHSSMNWKKYKYIFLQTSNDYADVLGGNFDVAPYSKEGLQLLHTYTPLEKDEAFLVDDEYALGTTIPGSTIPTSLEQQYIRIFFEKKDLEINGSRNVLFVAHISSNDSTIYYGTFKINDIPEFPLNEWSELEHTLAIPFPIAAQHLKLYFWNRDLASFEIRNYRIEIYS